MKIGFLQLDVAFEKIDRNIQRVQELLEPVEFDLMVLPELFATGCIFYNKQHAFSLSEPVPEGKISQSIIDIARKKNAWIIAGILERDGDRMYNSAIVAGPQGYLGKHRKVNLSMGEEDRFCGGDGYETFLINGVTVGILICVDNERAEAGEILAGKCVRLICQPANHQGVDMLDTFRAISEKNGVYTMSSNRVGFDHDTGLNTPFIGLSQIIDPDGRILHQAPENEESLYIMDLDLE